MGQTKEDRLQQKNQALLEKKNAEAKKAEEVSDSANKPAEQPTKKAKAGSKKMIDPAMVAPVIREGRNYAQSSIELDEQSKNNPIPVPDFSRTNVELDGIEVKKEADQEVIPGSLLEPEKKHNPSSPSSSSQPRQPKSFERGDQIRPEDIIDTSDLKRKDQKKQAKALAKTVVEGYQFLCNAGYQVWNYDENKLNRLVAKGKLDPAIFAMRVPIHEDRTMRPIGLLLSDYNEKLRETLTVDDEFKSEAIPLLTEIFERESMGLSPEWQLATMFIMDATTKIMGIVQLQGSINVVLKSLTAQVRLDRKKGQFVPPAEVPHIPKPEERNEETVQQVNPETDIQNAEEVNSQTLPTEQVERLNSYVQPEVEEIVDAKIEEEQPKQHIIKQRGN